MDIEIVEPEERLPFVRTASKFVVGKSVSGVIVTIVHQNTETFTKSQKIQLYVGAYVIGAMVADAAEDYIDKRIDDVLDAWDGAKSWFTSEKTDTPS